MLSVFVTALLLLKSVVCETIFPFTEISENSDCMTYDGLRGSCHPITACLHHYRDSLTRIRPKICSWDGNLPNVCCPSTNQGSIRMEVGHRKFKFNQTIHFGENSGFEIVPHHFVSTPNIARCGTRMNNEKAPFYVVGGSEVTHDQWPWIVSIMVKRGSRIIHICGGNIISDQFILTAAHCFPKNSQKKDYSVAIGNSDLENATIVEIQDFIQHPNYNHSSHYNDIALIKLRKPLVFTDNLRPICLPFFDKRTKEPKTGQEALIAGWGHKEYGGQSSKILREAEIELLPTKECNASYWRLNSRKLRHGITDSLICAGTEDGTRDSCQGDSGGPLIIFSNSTSVFETHPNYDGAYYQIGLVSFGHQCATKDFPGVYTKVAAYLNWILKKVNLQMSTIPPFN